MESKLEAMVSGRAPGDIVVPSEYEFDARQNEVIGGLSSSMKFVGVISIIFGILQMLAGVFNGMNIAGFLTMGQGAVLIAVGGWLASAAGSFRQVVTTEGNDITNMMFALTSLRKAYKLQAIVLAIACGLIVLGIILLFMATPHHSY